MVRVLLGIAIGGAIGFAIGSFGKCVSGACPLTGNPIKSSLIGAMIGALITLGK